MYGHVSVTTQINATLVDLAIYIVRGRTRNSTRQSRRLYRRGLAALGCHTKDGVHIAIYLEWRLDRLSSPHLSFLHLEETESRPSRSN